jgi:hypothetical protein
MMEGWKEKKAERVVADEEGESGCCLIWLPEGKKGGVQAAGATCLVWFAC